jgi:hypothetical protein
MPDQGPRINIREDFPTRRGQVEMDASKSRLSEIVNGTRELLF